jgi:hypothetical protein
MGLKDLLLDNTAVESTIPISTKLVDDHPVLLVEGNCSLEKGSVSRAVYVERKLGVDDVVLGKDCREDVLTAMRNSRNRERAKRVADHEVGMLVETQVCHIYSRRVYGHGRLE